jgi:hypothetical protein
VIPLFDDTGRVVGMYGRKITEGLRPGTPLHLYLPGPHRGVFNVEAFAASKEMILCEALIDALTFWSAGYRNVSNRLSDVNYSYRSTTTISTGRRHVVCSSSAPLIPGS